MVGSVYLDANVLLDFLVPDRANHDRAVRLVAHLSEAGIEAVISEDILTTVFYIAKDKSRVLEFFLSVRKKWRIVSFGEAVVAEGLERALRESLDLEDILQCLCAKNEGCAMVVTEDRGFVECGVRVMDYDTALREFEAR